MDPNSTLALLRSLRASESTADEVIAAFDELDEWLSNGGFLPDDWRFPTAANQSTDSQLSTSTLSEDW